MAQLGAVSRCLRVPLKPTEARLHATMLGCTPENCQRRPRAEVCHMIIPRERSYVSSHVSRMLWPMRHRVAKESTCKVDAVRSLHRHGSAKPNICILELTPSSILQQLLPLSSFVIESLRLSTLRPNRYPCNHLLRSDDSNGAVQHVDASCTCGQVMHIWHDWWRVGLEGSTKVGAV